MLFAGAPTSPPPVPQPKLPVDNVETQAMDIMAVDPRLVVAETQVPTSTESLSPGTARATYQRKGLEKEATLKLPAPSSKSVPNQTENTEFVHKEKQDCRVCVCK